MKDNPRIFTVNFKSSLLMEDTLNSDVIIVASCNVDLVSYVERMPQIGETLMGNSFKMGFGGKGANKAIACSRLGSNCAVISKLGNDVFGKDYLENFRKNKIRTEYVFTTDDAATGVAPIVVDKNGDNSILVILGANLLLKPDDIDKCQNLFINCKILVTNLEIPAETALHSLKLARNNNVTTILNFAPAAKEFNQELFHYTDYLILNEVEIEQLSKMQTSTIDETKAASLAILNKYNVKVGIIVTLGGNGVLYTDVATKSAIHITTTPVKVLDTSGAGDAFVGAFTHFLNKLGSDKIEKVIELASSYATLTVQSCGTQSSYPHLADIEKKFQV